jgi:hypothetical protein
MPMSRAFFLDLLRLMAILASGAGISEILIGHVGIAVVCMTLAVPAILLSVVPRQEWARVGASTLLMAATFGLARIAAELGHHAVDGDPLSRSVGGYAFATGIFGFCGLLWLIWRLSLRRRDRS